MKRTSLLKKGLTEPTLLEMRRYLIRLDAAIGLGVGARFAPNLPPHFPDRMSPAIHLKIMGKDVKNMSQAWDLM